MILSTLHKRQHCIKLCTLHGSSGVKMNCPNLSVAFEDTGSLGSGAIVVGGEGSGASDKQSVQRN